MSVTTRSSSGPHKRHKSNDEDKEAKNANVLWLARTSLEENTFPRSLRKTYVSWKVANNCLVVRDNEKLSNVLKSLSSEGFLSAPVLDANLKYVGFIDIMDITLHILDLFGVYSSPFLPSWEEDEWTGQFDKDAFKKATVVEAMQNTPWKQRHSPLDMFQTFQVGFSVLHGMSVLARSCCSHIPVVDADDKVVGIFTNSMAISFLSQHLTQLAPSIRNMKVRDLPETNVWQLSPPTACVESDLTINVFKSMLKRGVHGVAIVDSAGMITGNLSIRDIRGAGTDGKDFQDLFLSVAEFKKRARKRYPHLASPAHFHHALVPKTALSVTVEATIQDVIQLMDDGNVHRVFVVNDSQEPIGILSQRDVLLHILTQLGCMQPPQ